MNRLSSSQVRRLSGFGASTFADAYLFWPETAEQTAECFELARVLGKHAVLRGAGRSYGDAAYLPESIAIDTGKLTLCELDAATGVVTAGPGATIENLWRLGLPAGFWPPVVSGTMKTSLGGALAMNIHGKNAFKAGTLGEWVERIQITSPSGDIRWITNNEPEFRGIVSSAGLVAAITLIELRMKPVTSGLLDVVPFSCRNWEEQFQAFESNLETADYMVSWVDMFASGDSAGRGLFHSAKHVDNRDAKSLIAESQDLPTRILGLLPKSQVWRILKAFNRRPLMRLLNAMKHTSGKLSGKPYRQSLVEFSFLLDYVPGWERAYSPGGLIQYQCFVPKESARNVFGQIGEMCRSKRLESYLGVMKRHRPDNFVLSHGVDGYSLALDFKVDSRTWGALLSLCHNMNELVLDAGGKFYLAKDSTLRPEDVARFVPPQELRWLADLKSKYDPDRVLDSALNRRLNIV